MRVTSKGQVTIPQELREKMNFLPYTEVDFELTSKGILIKRSSQQKTRGKEIIMRMRGKGTVNMSTNEIMALTRN